MFDIFEIKLSARGYTFGVVGKVSYVISTHKFIKIVARIYAFVDEWQYVMGGRDTLFRMAQFILRI